MSLEAAGHTLVSLLVISHELIMIIVLARLTVPGTDEP